MNEILIGALSLALLVSATACVVLASGVRGREARPLEPAPKTPEAGEPRAAEIVERMSEGVLVLDERLKPLFTNAAARTMLGFQEKGPNRVPSEEILHLARRSLRYGREISEAVQLWFPYRSTIKVRILPLSDGTGAMILLRDITEEILAQKIRKEFVAHASHELKSPVASIQTLAEAVGQAVGDDPSAAAHFSEKLATEAGRLGRLVTDLLDLSRLEDPAQVPAERVDLSEVAQREVEQIRPAARAKGMRLVDELEAGICVKGDDQQLGLMIRNLLENAVRYTPERGLVSLSLKRRNGRAVLEVADSGIGIPLEAQTRVFERFYRVDRARSRDRGGTGLGLAIVKHVAELHGGHVSLESELGHGSVFTAALPALAPEEQLRSNVG